MHANQSPLTVDKLPISAAAPGFSSRSDLRAGPGVSFPGAADFSEGRQNPRKERQSPPDCAPLALSADAPANIAEIAAALGVSRRHARRLADAGRFGPSLIPGQHLYPLAALPAEPALKIVARRDAQRRAEAIETLKDCLAVQTPSRNLLDLTDRQRAEARARADLLLWIAAQRRADGLSIARAVIKATVHAELDPTCSFRGLIGSGKRGGNQITAGNVNRWLAAWRPHRRHDHDDHAWWVLADNHRRGPELNPDGSFKRDGDPRYWHHIALLYEGPQQLALLDCWAYAQRKGAELGWGDCPTPRQVQYWYARKTDKIAVQARRRGEKFTYNTIDLTARRDWSSVKVGDMWFSDHHMFNVFVRVPAPWAPGYFRAVRPWITQFLDCPTMHEVASIIRGRDADGDVILETWRQAVDTLGWCAATVVCDNGKDYRSVGGPRVKLRPLDEARVQTTAEILGVRASFALPFNARAKPCELDFSEVEQKFERRWPTYCGHDKSHADLLWPALKREKLAKYEGENNLFRGCLVNPELVPTLDEFADAYYLWRNGERESKTSDGIMLNSASPAAAWAAGLLQCRRPQIDAETRFVAFLRSFQRPQRVGRGGVVWFKRGESQRDWLRYHSPALYDYLASGQEVLVKVDTRDVSHCFVFAPAGDHGWKLINCGGPHGGCPAVADIPANTGMEAVRDLQRYNRSTRRAIRDGERAGEREQALRELAAGLGATNAEAALVARRDPAAPLALSGRDLIADCPRPQRAIDAEALLAEADRLETELRNRGSL